LAAAKSNKAKLGWIGTGRMGFEMAKRLAKAGCDITVWNRTRAKAEPLAKDGAKIVDSLPNSRLATSCSAWSRPTMTSGK